MGKFDGVLIASDLDGTLLTMKHTITEKNIQAIKYFQDNGGIFTVATGRPPLAVEGLFEGIDIKAPLVLANGAMIYDYNEKKIIECKNAPKELREFIYDTMEKFPEIGIELFTHTKMLLLQESSSSIHHFGTYNLPTDITKMENIPDFSTWLKLNFTSKNRALLEEFRDFYLEKNGEKYQSCFTFAEYFEVMHVEARKDMGVFSLAKMLNISKEHIYTIGDNDNDIFMVKNAKKGFAVSNAIEQLKEVAHKIVAKNDDSGIAEMIEYIDTLY